MSKTDPFIPLEWRDASVKPTDNFYVYTNGTWLENNPIPDDQMAWGSFIEIQSHNETLLYELLQKPVTKQDSHSAVIAKRYFQSAIDEAAIEAAGLEPISELLKQADAVNDAKSFAHALADLQTAGVSAFFGLQIMPDFEDATTNLVYVGQGGLGLPERSYYVSDDDHSVELQATYRAHIAALMEHSGTPKAQATKSAAAIYELEKALATVSMPPEELRDVSKTLNKLDFNAFAKTSKHFDMKAFFDRADITINALSVDNPAFFAALDAIYEQHQQTIPDYLRWHILHRYASALPAVFADEQFAFYGTVLSGQQQQKPRWKRALDFAMTDIGEAVAEVYVGEAFSAASKHRLEIMVQQLLAAMKDTIQNLDWMSDTTKAEAQHKLANFGYKIGYPDTWRDYTDLTITEGSPLATNRLLAARFETKRQLAKLNQPVDMTEWEMPAHMVNAYYHPLKNEIVFPAGILQPPMFYADADDPVIYGAIGAVIGHEITHGFDDQGRQFDATGRKHDWWTADDAQAFIDRSIKLVNQANEFEVLPNKFVNGQLTLGENIADLGGISLALHALQIHTGKPLTKEALQRFFLSYATMWRMNYHPQVTDMLLKVDPHAPAAFRTNAPLSNMSEFAQAFDAQDGDPMRRPDQTRVKIW